MVFRRGARSSRWRPKPRRLGKHPLVLSTPGQRGLAERVARLLGSCCPRIYDQAVMHVPLETARAPREPKRVRLEADCCVAIGGGSTVGLAKAIALELALPILASRRPTPARK